MESPAIDLGEAANRLVGPLVAEREAELVRALAGAIRRAGLVNAYRPVKLTSRQLAETRIAAARGLKRSSATRADFMGGITVAVRALSAPLARAR